MQSHLLFSCNKLSSFFISCKLSFTHRLHTPSLATLTKFLIPPKIMISLSPYICHYKCLRVIMQTKNLSSFMPLMPTKRDDTLLQHILHICTCSVTVNCNCIPGRKVRIRKSAREKVCFPICLHLLGCSSSLPSLFSTHRSVIWCALSAKVYHKLCRILFMLHISVCLSFTLTLSLYISHLSLFPLPLLPLYRLFSACSHWPPCCFSFSVFKTNHVSLINLLHSFILLRTSASLPSFSTFNLRFLIVKHPSHI